MPMKSFLLSLGERRVHPIPDLSDYKTEEVILRVQHKPVQQIPGTVPFKISLNNVYTEFVMQNHGEVNK